MSNIPQGYKPFNYEEAIKDISKVRTRLGVSITDLHKFLSSQKLCLYTVIEDEVCSFQINGKFHADSSESTYDLFLIDDSKIVIQIPEDTGIQDFAKEVAKVIVNNYGPWMHNQNTFIKTLLDELYKQG